MRIGIIGAGHIGGTLTRRLTQLGHTVYVANSRGPETLTDLKKETGAIPVTAVDAAHRGELVVVTIPLKNAAQLRRDLFNGVPESVPVVDTCNYYPKRDGHIAEIEDGLPESRWVERQLGHPVVKAFNNIYAQHLMERGRPAGDANRIALPVAGDLPGVKRQVMDLVDQLGFEPVDAGGLDDSWRQQPGTPVYATDGNAVQVRQLLAKASPARQAEWRAAS